ncbi:hypothetical protein H2201_007145 [Coniosporium apollinis]|uniref:Asteroid domain-containing protein n=1 Tax=Coniosporium apollinis TaxID=61459 RepID=A0ABQ9NJQ6_9PEZI|nr:hypothetical protein H2201_007145 [Coniosporium apollinis]
MGSSFFFDGLLPDAKKQTRVSRLQSYLDQLSVFRALNNQGLPAAVSESLPEDFTADELFSPVVVPSRLSALPASPFLVPAAIEALLHSEFGSVTTVVPGEADAYCADLARREGGIIVTGDSDLLAHDLGSNGSVTFFKDFELRDAAPPAQGTALQGMQYHPANIARSIGLKTLLPFAYAVSQDPHRGFAECVRLAKQQDEDGLKYRIFTAEYNSTTVHSTLELRLNDLERQGLAPVLKRLDPRISEYVHRTGAMLIPDSTLKLSQLSTGATFDMYLPFLIDDPSRASAWRVGADFRQLGYSMLGLTSLSQTRVLEHERRGTRISSTGVLTLNIKGTGSYAESLISDLEQWIDFSKTPVAPETSREFGTYQVCKALQADAKPLPSRTEMRSLIAGQRASGSWSFVHLCGQLQAVLYSLRMLQQLMEVFITLHSERFQGNDFFKTITRLQQYLNTLPSLTELFPMTQPERLKDEWEAEIRKILSMLGVEEDVFSQADNKRRKKRRKKGACSDAQLEVASSRPSNNIYSTLADS